MTADCHWVSAFVETLTWETTKNMPSMNRTETKTNLMKSPSWFDVHYVITVHFITTGRFFKNLNFNDMYQQYIFQESHKLNCNNWLSLHFSSVTFLQNQSELENQLSISGLAEK